MRKFLIAVVAATALLLHAVPASATIATSALRGVVRLGGAPARGVTVTVSSPALLAPRTTVTDRRGRFWLEVPPGSYEVTYSRAGLQTLIRRVVVELARVSRADAKLEASEDEETITSTAKSISVSDTTAITTRFTGADLDRLPVDRRVDEAAALSPGIAVDGPTVVIDDAPFIDASLLGREPLEEVTVIRGALPVEYGPYRGRVAVARTRSGGEDFSLSIRDTITDEAWIAGDDRESGTDHLFETASGGRIVPGKLWLFAAGWSGDRADRGISDNEGFELKLSSQLGSAHSLTAMHLDSEASFGFFDADSSLTLARYSGLLRENLTVEAVASRSEATPHSDVASPLLQQQEDDVTVKVSWFLASHLFTAGIQSNESRQWGDGLSIFVNDRWADGRWAVNGGLRYATGDDDDQGDRVIPRVAATYDLHGDGRQAFTASYGEYDDPRVRDGGLRQMSAGFATAIGASGSARADIIRNDYESFGVATSLELDARYRMFDRFELGGNYSWMRWDEMSFAPEHFANLWVGLELPVAGHELGAMLLERYQSSSEMPGAATYLSTDLTLRYTIAIRRAAVTLAADATNLFDRDESLFQKPRTIAFWTRLAF